jgi:hypothetical protein
LFDYQVEKSHYETPNRQAVRDDQGLTGMLSFGLPHQAVQESRRSIVAVRRALAAREAIVEPPVLSPNALLCFDMRVAVVDLAEAGIFEHAHAARWNARAFESDGLLGAELVRLRPQVLALLENKFLDPRIWREPRTSHNHRSQYHRALTLYIERRWRDLLTLTLDRVYVLRGQIVHGAATRGSNLNRAVLSRYNQVLEGLLPPMLHLAIEHGAHDDWPPLWYPPVYEDGPQKSKHSAARRAR